ncbi:MAG: Tripartite ATP-independent transporter solute receptor, DctP family [Herbaspirillum sp.]|jgi:tripartite ATP-independent transporter DctP family solute receptor|nr:Tripartite ATP-independent transporter solute receptor, DctP family [Herbaspirillum sp.]
MSTISRRGFLRSTAAAVALPAITIFPSIARAADFSYKCGHDLPDTHPVHVRMQEAAVRIKEETAGRFDLQIFGNNQLGGDTDMLAQVRSGGLEMTLMPDVILGTLTPVASISGVGFAFSSDEEACKAMDGELGAHVRKNINKAGLLVMDKIWENGFRQITSSVKPIKLPEDLRSFKIRVPVAPLWMSMFKAFNSGPTALNFNELYSALQTKIVEGQENPLSTIYAGKLYEVQKYCSITNHLWNGYWMLMNPRTWNALPKDIQEIVAKNLNRSALELRSDVAKLNVTLEKTLTEKGMLFNRTDPKPFRHALNKAGFYAEWRKKFGDESWAILTRTANGLA